MSVEPIQAPPPAISIENTAGDASTGPKNPTPPSSTVVEAPRSPNPLNPAAAAPTGVPPSPTSSPNMNGTMSFFPPKPSSKGPSPIRDAYPTPANTSFDAVARSGSRPNSVGPDGQSGLKRHGDDLTSADAKRVKEESPAGATAPAASAPNSSGGSAPVDAAAADPNAADIVYPWTNYVEPAPRPAGPTTPLTLAQHKYLVKAVGNLVKSHNSFNFREPVDTVKFNIPHYHQIIPRPMDLGTVITKLHASDPRGPPKDKSKLSNWDTSKGTYSNVAGVTNDIRQIWENTRKFNGLDHVVSQAASKLEEQWERSLRTLPADQPASSPSTPGMPAPPNRRASIFQPPVIRRTDDSVRPKREIHPPPSKDLGYEPGGARKPKRRNDPQLQWAARTIKAFENTQKYFDIVSAFLYPITDVIAAIPEYKTIIKEPIDLLIIKSKLEEGTYEDVAQVDRDIRLLVSNATTFNPPGDAVYNSANALLQLWQEKSRTMPPKPQPEARAPSEDAVGEDMDDSDDEDKDVVRLKEAKAERAALDREIADLEAKIARKPAKRKPKTPKQTKAPRKYSTSKASPAANGNGSVAKKARKPKEQPSYREDDDSEEEIQTITITQKQELAEKIQVAEAEVLAQAVEIIQSSTEIVGDQEIELDIDSLPGPTVIKLYNLVCRPRKRGKKNKVAARKSGFGGAPGRKHLNEQEEADRIRKMEAQLQSFEGGRSAAAPTYQEEESSEEEESSDEE